MSGDYEKGYYRGKRVWSENDLYWMDRDEDAITDRLLAFWAKKYGTPARVVTEFDPSNPSEAEREAHEEAAW